MLDASGDYVFGHGAADFFVNVPETVGQSVLTRLRLFAGEWFLDLSDGTQWDTKVLGKYTGALRDLAVRQRILQTVGVTGIAEYDSSVDSVARKFAVSATMDTQFGQTTIQTAL